MGNIESVAQCLGRESVPRGPRRFANLSPEEAYMIKRQQDLRLYVYSCQEFEKAFKSNLHFQNLREDDFVDTLQNLKLLRPDAPKSSLHWTQFYQRMKIEAPMKSVCPFFEIRSVMIALYLLSSSKPMQKA